MTDSTSTAHQMGLTDEEVARSRQEHGDNVLTPPHRPSLWSLYLEKFNDPVVRVLLVAVCLSLLISLFENEYAETIGIVAAILLATGIGFLFEYDANRKFDLLNAVNEESPVAVRRGGRVRQIPRREVVVGDVVLLSTGQEVPADGLLIEAVSLQVNESSLTGEPVVAKSIDPGQQDAEATYPTNQVLRGTTVVDGHGIFVVHQVGDATEIGKVARLSSEQPGEPTPLHRQLTRLAHLIGRVGFSVAGVAFAILFIKDVWLHYDFTTLHSWSDWLPVVKDTLQYFMMAVTLIVVAVPEGLPMSVTLSLALNMRRMLSTNNLVRRMHACETMGAINVICTDKTGTLTQNQMQVYEARFFFPPEEKTAASGEKQPLVCEGMAANSTAYLEGGDAEAPSQGVGNPTEVALLLWLQSQGSDYLALREGAKVIDQLTFSTERKLMATLVDSPLLGRRVLYVKGAPEIILSHCTDLWQGDKKAPIASRREEIDALLQRYQGMAMRTLAFAYRLAADGESSASQLEGLTFLGLTAISDPVRPDVPEAVAECRQAGIQVKIVTGDTSGTATEIARQIGLWDETDTERQRITGSEFAALSDEEALERVTELKVMSRARPSDKQRLVQLLQQRGAIVAVTGDGTNDAPALNYAHVGLSMGTGTSVAKEASDITLMDDSFRSIGTAVMWGRSLYKNIQRFILFQLTINFVALFTVLVGSLVGTALPLTVTQMLWVNLIMDTFAALALASTPPSRSVMHDSPRNPQDFIITRPMALSIVGMGLFFSLLLMGVLLYFEQATPEGLTLRRLTLFFTLFVLLQFWNLFNARVFGTSDSAFRGLRHSYGLEVIAAAILIGQFLIVQWGGSVFRTVPLDAPTWLLLLGSTSLVLWVGEGVRYIQRLKLQNHGDKKHSKPDF